LKVIPTELGRHTLNQFWPYWLRQLVLRNVQPLGSYSVEIQNKYVLISGGKTRSALEAVVMGLAAQIRPLPTILELDNEGPEHSVRWAIKRSRRYIPIGMIVDAIKVPRGVTLSFNSWLYFNDNYPSLLSVSCRHNDRRSMRDLRLNVELQVALMCG
jgi:hypothetical protein